MALIAVMVPIGMAADSDSGSANGASILLGFVFLTAVYVGAIWFMIKVVYTIPAMAEEGLDAIPSIKRSFQLTKGAFWKTFGYQLVLGLIGMALFLVPYFVMMGAAFALAQSQGQNSAAALTGMGFALLVLYAVLAAVRALPVPVHRPDVPQPQPRAGRRHRAEPSRSA